MRVGLWLAARLSFPNAAGGKGRFQPCPERLSPVARRGVRGYQLGDLLFNFLSEASYNTERMHVKHLEHKGIDTPSSHHVPLYGFLVSPFRPEQQILNAAAKTLQRLKRNHKEPEKWEERNPPT